MKTLASALALAAAIAGSAAAANDQLAWHAKLSPTEATVFSLSDLAAIKFNGDARQDDHQSFRTAGDDFVVEAGRSAAPDRLHLVAAAGLDPAEAGALGLSELTALKFNRDTAAGDRQSIRTSSAPISASIVWQPGDDDN